MVYSRPPTAQCDTDFMLTIGSHYRVQVAQVGEVDRCTGAVEGAHLRARNTESLPMYTIARYFVFDRSRVARWGGPAKRTLNRIYLP